MNQNSPVICSRSCKTRNKSSLLNFRKSPCSRLEAEEAAVAVAADEAVAVVDEADTAAEGTAADGKQPMLIIPVPFHRLYNKVVIALDRFAQ